MENLVISRQLDRITTRDFVLRTNQLNYESETATYIVPAKRMLEIPDDFIGLKLMTGERFVFTTGVGVTTQTLTLSHSIARDSLIELRGANVIVVRRIPVPVEEWAIANYTVTEPRTVVLTGLIASTAYQFDIYYLFGGGSLNISVISSNESARTKILERAIRAVNMVNQEDVRVGLKPGMIGLCIPERFRIHVNVITPARIIWHDPAETAFSSPFARESFIELPVNVSNLLQWPAGIEIHAKQQLLGL